MTSTTAATDNAAASPPAAAVATATRTSPRRAAVTPEQQLQGIDVAKVLREKGPIVSCVVLRATSTTKNDDDSKKPSSSDDNALHSHLMDEIQMDTTPKKNEVESILGGPFTFVGQYEEEGVMLMARRDCVVMDKDNDDLPKDLPMLNPHKLQPPFDTTKIYGDILVLKVAAVADEDNAAAAVPSNEDFFLNYSKDEYLKFARRTDVVPPEPVVHEEEEEDEEEACDEEEEEEEGNEWSGGEEDDDDEEEDPNEAMMNLILSEVLRKFKEEHGREPSEEEHLVLKTTVMHKLGMKIPGVDDDDEDEDGKEEEEKKAAAVESNEGDKKRAAVEAPAGVEGEPEQKKAKSDTSKTVLAQ